MLQSFKFLGVHITNKFKWSKHTKTVVKRAQQSLFTLRKLKRFGMGPQILKRFYSCNKESITGCITAWYGNCSTYDRKALQRVMRTVQYITGAKLPAIQDLYTRRCQRKALKIVKDPSHPSHSTTAWQQFLPPSHKATRTICIAPPTPLKCCCYSLFIICIVTLTIHSCTYYLN